MDLVNSKIYSIMETAFNLFLLNLLWIIMCLPVVTIFPATAAMLGVVRHWAIFKESNVVKPFFRYFKENFRQSFALGAGWLLFSYLIYVNYQFISEWPSVSWLLLPVLMVVTAMFAVTTILSFPIMVHYKVGWRDLLKNSLVSSISYFPTTLAALIILAGTGMMVVKFPIAILIIFSLSAYGIFMLYYRVFEKLEQAVRGS